MRKYYCLLILFFVAVIWINGCSKGPENMVKVPEGPFIMGDNLNGQGKRIFLKAFYIDKHEVTNGEYKIFVEKTGYRKPTNWIVYGYKEELKDHPVVYVSFKDASAYCKWAGKRLPTEAEWEKAARGTDGRIYPWGNKFEKDRANTSLSGIVGTTRVGSYKKGVSPYGAYDMAGNVWEWTTSDSEGNTKIVKGGSWGLSHRFAKTFARLALPPDKRLNNVGFRCVKDVQ